MKKQITIGSLFDIGLSIGIAGFSPCQNGKETSWNVTHPLLGRYGGIRVLFKAGNLDGVAFGIGGGLTSPISYTMDLDDFFGEIQRVKK